MCGLGQMNRVNFNTAFRTSANIRYISHRPVTMWKKPSALSPRTASRSGTKVARSGAGPVLAKKSLM
jgi:hypothetical protein